MKSRPCRQLVGHDTNIGALGRCRRFGGYRIYLFRCGTGKADFVATRLTTTCHVCSSLLEVRSEWFVRQGLNRLIRESWSCHPGHRTSLILEPDASRCAKAKTVPRRNSFCRRCSTSGRSALPIHTISGQMKFSQMNRTKCSEGSTQNGESVLTVALRTPATGHRHRGADLSGLTSNGCRNGS
jgi:hypothetical protein